MEIRFAAVRARGESKTLRGRGGTRASRRTQSSGKPEDLLFLNPNHAVLESPQLRTIFHAELAIVEALWTGAAGTLHGLDD